MDYTRLGRSGLRVSRICLGALTFGRETDEKESFSLMDRYVELGGNFIDTADKYSAGRSEETVGRWLKQRGIRDNIVLATKVRAATGPGPNDSGLSRLHIQRAVEASLRRLQTNTIDIYQIHSWDANTPVEETMCALNDLVRQGKVCYVGCSNLTGWQLSKYLKIADRHLWSRFVSIQSAYSVLNRSIENEILPLCEEEGLGVTTWNPLAGGMLTGKYKRGQSIPTGTRFHDDRQYLARYYTDEALAIVERFVKMAEQKGITPAQLAVAWILGEQRVTCPIVGARNVEQFNDSVGAMKVTLGPDERATIPAVPVGRRIGIDLAYDRKI